MRNLSSFDVCTRMVNIILFRKNSCSTLLLQVIINEMRRVAAGLENLNLSLNWVHLITQSNENLVVSCCMQPVVGKMQPLQAGYVVDYPSGIPLLVVDTLLLVLSDFPLLAEEESYNLAQFHSQDMEPVRLGNCNLQWLQLLKN